ncbi:(Fe-S)-binding protein [Streptomyces iconiensis]|uniref:(Fe-S)-binding protein n=1 Tax=Streptomyces iconiensis TaxID=1384038 RepID=A0ABT7A129_9ACTN|nr:(Fe-S)-binding protein [Streptomyces iconiensis]MDJ1135034.1 (Fe-S)-binding protein [Streptomyces iconiensis]
MRTALFITCLNDALYPGTGRATVTLLRRLGVEVEFPAGQSCCGQMHYNTGYRADTAALARHFVTVFGGYDRVVVPSASCGGLIKNLYNPGAGPLGDAGLRRDLAAVAGKVHELMTFLTDELATEDVGAYFPHRVTYHPTCHSLRVLRVGDRPYRLLRNVTGIEYTELDGAEECCGFGGTFCLKNPAASGAMNADKARHVRESGAHVVTAGDNSCLMNIQGRLTADGDQVRCLHLAEILARTEEDGPLPGVPLARTAAGTPKAAVR